MRQAVGILNRTLSVKVVEKAEIRPSAHRAGHGGRADNRPTLAVSCFGPDSPLSSGCPRIVCLDGAVLAMARELIRREFRFDLPLIAE